jgi:hypothetical protein
MGRTAAGHCRAAARQCGQASERVMGYMEKLEKDWRKNRNNHRRHFPHRPRSLRGRDFVFELIRPSAATGDRRFDHALTALITHGIIDANFNFKRWRPPKSAEIQAHTNRITLGATRYLIEELGKTQRRACAEVAAVRGLEATSFEAAIRKLQMLLSSTAKKGAA